MYDFILPNYKGNSIVNLMSSISNNFGVKHIYPQLKSLRSKELEKSKNIVLVVVDGLGYNYLKRQKNSFLWKNIKTKITSTFLSSTTCANTCFLTGYPPQQTGLTGWDMNLKEIGAITAVLPFIPMFGGEKLSEYNFNMKDLIEIESIHKNFQSDCFTVLYEKYASSPFNKFVSKYTQLIPVKDRENIFPKIEEIVKTNSNKRKFIHTYFPEIDKIAHEYGISSKEVKKEFKYIDNALQKLAKSIQKTETTIIIVADHGFIDTSPDKEIWVENIKGLSECLTIPLTGEPRVRGVFIRSKKKKTFKKIIKSKMSKYCWCFTGEQLIRDGFYGTGKPNKKLNERVGDYVIIMKDNYILRDKLANYQKPDRFHKGKHGGVTEDEMFVPLIII